MALSIGQSLGWQGNPLYDAVSPFKNTIANAGLGLMSGRNWTEGLQNAAAGAVHGSAADQAYQERMQQEEKAKEEINMTIEWMRNSGFPQLADAAVANPARISELFSIAAQQSFGGPAAPIKVGQGETLLDPSTYEPIYQGAPDPKDQLAIDKEGFDRESALWKEYMAAEPVKTYQALRNSFERIRQSAATDSGPGDLGLIFNYMKMLDPGSVVREGEFATAENAGGVGAQITNLYNRVISGERLTPELRQQFVAAAERLYAEASQNLEDINSTMGSRATGWGVDPNRFVFQPETYQPLVSPKFPNVTITRLP